MGQKDPDKNVNTVFLWLLTLFGSSQQHVDFSHDRAYYLSFFNEKEENKIFRFLEIVIFNSEVMS